MYGKIENIKRFFLKKRETTTLNECLYIHIYILNEGAIKYNFNIIKKKI